MKYVKRTAGIACMASALLFASCNSPEGDAAQVSEAQATTATDENATAAAVTMKVDTTASEVDFEGVGVGHSHKGTFFLDNGEVQVQDGKVTGGQFTIDINSMELEEKGEMILGKLRPHLMSGDFFEAQKYPTATFEITSVEPYSPKEGETVVAGANNKVSGNLTIKGITKNVTFPAKLDVNENGLTAKADFLIDRTQWDMVYNKDRSVGDNFIEHDVNIELDLKASK